MLRKRRCGEPGCSQMFSTGRARRRHVHKEHRRLPYICAHCQDEPFMTDAAKQQHIKDGHIKVLYRPGVSPPTLTPPDLFDVCSEKDLNEFIANTIQPDKDFLKTCGLAIDKVVKFLQNNAPASVRPSRVIKLERRLDMRHQQKEMPLRFYLEDYRTSYTKHEAGGSLCKETAVKGKSDIDIDAMLANYTSVHDLVADMDSILETLETYMRKYPCIEVTRYTTHRCVQIKISAGGHTIEADILPAVDLLANRSPTDIYREMRGKDSDDQGYYSPCLAPLQRELFEEIPTEVKSLIRLLKYWKKSKLQTTALRIKWPASYALELIVIHCWTAARKPECFNMVRALYAVLNSLVNHTGFRITFPDRMFYPKAFLDFEKIKVPYIMDPCNPYNNVYYKGSFKWKETGKMAKEWLQKSLFFPRPEATKNKW